MSRIWESSNPDWPYTPTKLRRSGRSNATGIIQTCQDKSGSLRQAQLPWQQQRDHGSQPTSHAPSSGTAGLSAFWEAGTTADVGSPHGSPQELSTQRSTRSMPVHLSPAAPRDAAGHPPSPHAFPAGPGFNQQPVQSAQYTVQYIGVAHGELGILTKRQTLPRSPSGAPRSRSASPTRRSVSHISRVHTHSRASTPEPPQEQPSDSPDPAPAPEPDPDPGPRIPSGREPSQPGSPTAAAVATGSPLHTHTHTHAQPPPPLSTSSSGSARASPSPRGALSQRSAAPSDPGPGAAARNADGGGSDLRSLVEDACGRARVVTNQFYSRALHSSSGSRAGGGRSPSRRLAVLRGPVAQDKELAREALPARFAMRAPGAGGFPGWKLVKAHSHSAGPARAGAGAGAGRPRQGQQGQGGATGVASLPGIAPAGLLGDLQSTGT